jgi:hypothetical protein
MCYPSCSTGEIALGGMPFEPGSNESTCRYHSEFLRARVRERGLRQVGRGAVTALGLWHLGVPEVDRACIRPLVIQPGIPRWEMQNEPLIRFIVLDSH